MSPATGWTGIPDLAATLLVTVLTLLRLPTLAVVVVGMGLLPAALAGACPVLALVKGVP